MKRKELYLLTPKNRKAGPWPDCPLAVDRPHGWAGARRGFREASVGQCRQSPSILRPLSTTIWSCNALYTNPRDDTETRARSAAFPFTFVRSKSAEKGSAPAVNPAPFWQMPNRQSGWLSRCDAKVACLRVDQRNGLSALAW